MKNSALKKTGQILRVRCLSSLIEIYLSHVCMRVDLQEASKLALWVRSTIQPEAYALSMIWERIVNHGYSASQILELINVSKKAAYQMVKDCTSEFWLIVHCDGESLNPLEVGSCNDGIKYCTNDELLVLERAFVNRHIIKMEEPILNKIWAELVAFAQIKEKINHQE